MARPSRWYFAVYKVAHSGLEDPDRFVLDALRKTDVLAKDGFEWCFCDVEEISHGGETYVFGFLYKNKPLSERQRVDKRARRTTTEPLEDDLRSRAPFFLRPDHHILAFHPQGNDISLKRFGKMFAELIEHASKIGFVSVYFNTVTEAEDIFKAIGEFARIATLRVALTIPNPNLNPLTREIFEELQGSHTNEYRAKYSSRHADGLRVSEGSRLQKSVRMAADGYGTAELEGSDRAGRSKKASTRQFPATQRAPSVKTEAKTAILSQLAVKFSEILSRWRGNG